MNSSVLVTLNKFHEYLSKLLPSTGPFNWISFSDNINKHSNQNVCLHFVTGTDKGVDHLKIVVQASAWKSSTSANIYTRSFFISNQTYITYIWESIHEKVECVTVVKR